MGHAAWHLRPLHQRLLDKLKERPKLFADETTVPVLDPGRGRTKTGQLWAYAADDRPWGGSDPPGAVYVYAPDRKAERPITHLDGFKGVLQVDGYAGYRKLAERGDVQLAFCWVHGTRPTSAVLSDAGYFAKRVTLSLALRSSSDAGRGFRRVGAAAALVAR